MMVLLLAFYQLCTSAVAASDEASRGERLAFMAGTLVLVTPLLAPPLRSGGLLWRGDLNDRCRIPIRPKMRLGNISAFPVSVSFLYLGGQGRGCTGATHADAAVVTGMGRGIATGCAVEGFARQLEAEGRLWSNSSQLVMSGRRWRAPQQLVRGRRRRTGSQVMKTRSAPAQKSADACLHW